MNDKRTLTGALVRAIAGQFGAVNDVSRAAVLRGRRAACRLVRAGRAPQWSRGPQTSHVACLMSRRSRVGSSCLMSVFSFAPCRTSHVGGLMSHVPCLMSPRAQSSKPGRSYDDRRSPQCTSPTVSPRPDYLACICRPTALADRNHSRRHTRSPSAPTQLTRRRRHRPLPAAGATSSRPPSRLSHAPASQTPHDSR